MTKIKGATKIKSNELKMSIKHLLGDLEQDTRMAIYLSTKFSAEKAVEELKHAGDFKGRKYRNSWTYTIKQYGIDTEAIVHNAKYYRLTHLLEYGHPIKRGGRKVGDAQAFEHIYPVNKKMEEWFEQEFRAYLENAVSMNGMRGK